MNLKYSILQWSAEDQKYIVSFPEFGSYAHTHAHMKKHLRMGKKC
jgi:predicted RNase H-like HicB family nuclease